LSKNQHSEIDVSANEELKMRKAWIILSGAAVLSILAAAPAIMAKREAKSEPAKATSKAVSVLPPADVKTTGIWQPPAGQRQIQIWPKGAPDMGGVKQPAESVLTAVTPEALEGGRSESVHDVSSPTMTLFPPKGRNTGAAIVVFPGGGFKGLAVTIEGTEICNWVTAKGITCVLSKYRVPNSNHYYDANCDCGVTPKVLRALQDAQRTIRLLRSKASELGLDPKKIGVIGFSAGGYLVAQTSNIFAASYTPVDAIDKISSRPDFAIAFFPGHLCRAGKRLDPGIKVTEKTPPTFLVQAWDDPVDPICNSTLYIRALNEAGVATEVHLFAKGGHAFGLRRKRSPDTVWPSLVENWLKDIDVLER
jgi:acetyl esterase/lipase